MRPYYQRGGVTVYHGDALEVLPTLGREWAHLLLTDPPYGVRYESNHRTATAGFGPIAGDGTEDAGRAIVGMAWTSLMDHRHSYVFGPESLLDGQHGDRWTRRRQLVWDKIVMSGGDLESPWGTAHECVTFAVKERSGVAAARRAVDRVRKPSVLRYQRPSGAGVVHHPTEKPVALLRELIESSSRIGETVLDPFTGSGSTLVAAVIESRQAIGIDIEERHCETSARRLDQAMAQGALL